MKTKLEILADINEGLRTGVLSSADLQPYVNTSQGDVAKPEPKSGKLSAVDIMFYIAGIVLFATVMSVIIQSWSGGDHILHILLSVGIGSGLWSLAYYLIKGPVQNDLRKGLTNSLLLTGSLLLVVGGYITLNEFVGGYDDINFVPAAFALLILGALHAGFDRLIKRDLTLLMGVLLAVAALPSLLFGLIQNSNAPVDQYSIILVISACLLAGTTRLVANVYPGRQNIRNSFDSFAAFIALMSMYVANFGDYGGLWMTALIATVLGIFYLSIILQNKHLLGTGSFFMVLTIITIAFKYFSGFGITFSLVVATFGLLGSAVVATSINKKYFKNSESK